MNEITTLRTTLNEYNEISSIEYNTEEINKLLSKVNENLENIKVMAITGNSNIRLLEKQARKFQPELVVVMDEKKNKNGRKKYTWKH